MIIEIKAEYQLEAGTTKHTPNLALTGEYLWENHQPRYNGTALYIPGLVFPWGTATVRRVSTYVKGLDISRLLVPLYSQWTHYSSITRAKYDVKPMFPFAIVELYAISFYIGPRCIESRHCCVFHGVRRTLEMVRLLLHTHDRKFFIITSTFLRFII